MSEKKKAKASETTEDFYETEYRRHKIRVVQPRSDAAGSDIPCQAQLYIDDEEIPVEVTESGVYSHESMYTQYGTVEELAEELIRQRGTAEIVKSNTPPPDDGHDHDHDHDH